MDIEERFADGVSAVHITGNQVRIDWMTLQPHLKSENGQPVYNINHRTIIPLEGFIQAFNTQKTLVEQLMKSGIARQEGIVFDTSTVKKDNTIPDKEVVTKESIAQKLNADNPVEIEELEVEEDE